MANTPADDASAINSDTLFAIVLACSDTPKSELFKPILTLTSLDPVFVTQSSQPSRKEDFVSSTVPNYDEDEFMSHFRMKRAAFDNLLGRIIMFLNCRVYSPDHKLLSFLWLMGNTETFRSVADRFGMGKSSLHRAAVEVAEALLHLAQDTIKFPKDRPSLQLATIGFKVPNVIGCIDGTYIPMLGKKGVQREAYICRKGFPAMHMQIVCDSNLKILDVCAGYPGSVHDARVFRNSPIAQELKTLPRNFHLLGDSAYALDVSVMTPFRDNGHLTQAQKNFNYRLSSDRACVERCIGLLKGKFRRLKKFDARDDVLMCKQIVCCAILHNIILESEVISTGETSQVQANNNPQHNLDITENTTATDKRNLISQLL